MRQEYPIGKIGSRTHKVDFLLGRDSNQWMLDLKNPGDKCEKYVEQLQSYMSRVGVALGVLFNGRSVLAYVNPQHPSVADILQDIPEQEFKELSELDLTKNPVKKASVNTGNTREMVAFFDMLRCNAELPDIEVLAKRLTKEYTDKIRREAKAAARSAAIKQALCETLQNPDDQIAKAIIGASSSLSSLRPTPTAKEILDVWSTLSLVLDSPPSGKRRRDS